MVLHMGATLFHTFVDAATDECSASVIYARLFRLYIYLHVAPSLWARFRRKARVWPDPATSPGDFFHKRIPCISLSPLRPLRAGTHRSASRSLSPSPYTTHHDHVSDRPEASARDTGMSAVPVRVFASFHSRIWAHQILSARHHVLSRCAAIPYGELDASDDGGDLLDDLVMHGGFANGSGFDSCGISDVLYDIVNRFGQYACALVEEAMNRLAAAEPVTPALIQSCRRDITREWVELYAQYLRDEDFQHDFLPEEEKLTTERDDDAAMDLTSDDYVMDEQDDIEALGAYLGSLMIKSGF